MKISIITVAYNSAATIGDTLQSVAEQSHPDIEHIVIDGNSRDDTLRVVADRGQHVTRVISEPDQGIYDAMNKGLRVASGDLIGFLNADDMYAGTDTVAQIAACAQATKADAVYGDLLYVNAIDTARVVRRWRSGDFRPGRLKFGWMPPHPTFYLHRSRLIQAGEFDTRLRIAADYDLMLRCLQQPDFQAAYLDQVLVHMRVGGASNRSLKALWRKSAEDLFAMRKNRVGGLASLACKNLRKLPQFLWR